MRIKGISFRLFSVSLLVAAVAGGSVFAQDGNAQYRLIELRTDDGSGGSTKAYALNNTGQIVGWMESEGNRHSAHWHVEATTDLHGTVHFDLLHPYAYASLPYSESYDISNADQIVGTAQTEIECPPPVGKVLITNAFILRPAVLTDPATPYSGDAFTNLGTLGAPCGDWDSVATGISNRNHVVGWADAGSMRMHAFLYSMSTDAMIDLGMLRADSDPVSSAAAVNDKGQVTGYSYTLATPPGATNPVPKAAYRAFVITPNDTNSDGDGDQWVVDGPDGENTLMADVGTLGGYNSWGRDINDDGDVVGESDTDPAVTGEHYTRAFIWSAGKMTDLGSLGGGFSAASGINSRSASDGMAIVGWASNADLERRAFIYRDGEMRDLNNLICTQSSTGLSVVPNIILTEARDINDDGWIVGWGTVRGDTSRTRGFLLVPIDPNDCGAEVVAGESTDSGDSGGTDTVTSGESYDGSQIVGTPGSTTGGTTGTDATTDGTDSTPTTAPLLCGFGTFAMLPLLIVGVCCAKASRALRVRRKE